MNLEHLMNALGEGLLNSSSLGGASSTKTMKRSKIKALLELAGDAESFTSTLAYLVENVGNDPKLIEELCDELHANSFPPARLPWIPVVQSQRSLVNTVYYQLWESNVEEKCRSLQLQRVIAASIPYYLPKRYHSIDCLSLLKHSSGDKCLHFANATQLFTFNQLYGLQYWLLVNHVHQGAKMELKGTIFLLTSVYHSHNTQKRLFTDQEDLHQCESPGEFLLEPWLLMQLPWNPALYNQWLAAALAEVLTAKKEIVEFYRWPVPTKLFFAVRMLLSQVETLHRRLLIGAGLINWLTNSGSGFEANLFTAKFVLNHVILPSLTTIEFLVTKKFYEVAHALKRMAWIIDGKVTKGEDYVAICSSEISIDNFQTMYGLRFFEKDKAADIFGLKKDSFKNMLLQFDLLPSEIDFVPMQSYYHEIEDCQQNGDCVLWKKKKEEIKLLTKKIVGKRVKGEVAISDSIWKGNSRFFAGSYRQNLNHADFEKGVQPNDVSVIYNLHSLQAKLVVADEEATCSGLVYLKLKNEGRNVHLHAPNLSGPDMSLEIMEELLMQISSKNWTLETLKEKIPAECKATISCEENCPGSEVAHQDAIKIFELRIKKLVYHIFDVSSTKGFEEEIVLPEWQFIQYLLPCFVTHLGQLASNCKTKPNELQTYTCFVHNLIQSFELNLTKTKLIKGTHETLKMSLDMELPDWMCKNQTNNVVEQLQAVESELGMLVHGTHKKTRKAGSADFPLGQICFRLLIDTLKKNTLSRVRPIIFKCWIEIILHYIPRLKEAIYKVALVTTNPFPINNLLQAVAVLEQLKNIVVTCNFNSVDELSLACLEKADQKVKIMMGKQPSALRSKLEKKLNLEMQLLSVQQLLGLALFGFVVCWKNHDKTMLKIFDSTQTFQPAIINSAIDKFVRNDWHGLQSLLSPLLCDKDGNDLSSVTMDFVKKSASSCYRRVHESIKMRDSKNNYFLSLYPIIPIKFCRCCVKFEVKLIKCKICVDNFDFPDVHWFCSDKCEEKSLAEGHLEEHDRHLMVKCGLV